MKQFVIALAITLSLGIEQHAFAYSSEQIQSFNRLEGYSMSDTGAKHFSADANNDMMYNFVLKDGEEKINDSAFLMKISFVDKEFVKGRMDAYMPGNISNLAFFVGLLSMIIGGTIMLIGAPGLNSHGSGTGQRYSNQYETPGYKFSQAMVGLSYWPLLGGAVISGASVPFSAWFNFLSPPPRQFNYVEARRMAAKYNAEFPERSKLKVLRPNEL